MEAENIKARLSFGIEEQGNKGFIYDFNQLKFLNAEKVDLYDTFLDIGTIVVINDTKYRIKNIRTLFRDHTVNMKNAPGYNFYGIGEILDYNFEILYFVEEVI